MTKCYYIQDSYYIQVFNNYTSPKSSLFPQALRNVFGKEEMNQRNLIDRGEKLSIQEQGLIWQPYFVVILTSCQHHPTETVQCNNDRGGASFLFEWDFHLQDEDEIKLAGFIFGLWENGYTTFYLMTVTKKGRVIYNPQMNKTHPRYVGRVTWEGNISKSYLAHELLNLTFSDSNTYGCQIDVGGFRRTIYSKITLNVQVRF